MKRSTITVVFFTTFSVLLWSCSKKEGKTTQVSPNLPSTPYEYRNDHKNKISALLWIHGTEIRYVESGAAPTLGNDIVVTNSGVTLGRVIFYDNGTTININNNCNGCHSAPPNGNRLNVARHSEADLADIHTQAGVESPDRLVERMLAKPYYAQLFKDAYGTSEITPERITDALSQYMTAMSEVGSQEALVADPRFADPFK
jgi:cytochrome c peroxidase